MQKKTEQNTYISNTPLDPSNIDSRLAEHNTAIELIKQDIRQEFLHMKESVDSLAAQFKELKEQLISGFVTKEQHANLESRVAQIENMKDWVIKIVLGSVIIALLAVIGLNK